MSSLASFLLRRRPFLFNVDTPSSFSFFSFTQSSPTPLAMRRCKATHAPSTHGEKFLRLSSCRGLLFHASPLSFSFPSLSSLFFSFLFFFFFFFFSFLFF